MDAMNDASTKAPKHCSIKRVHNSLLATTSPRLRQGDGSAMRSIRGALIGLEHPSSQARRWTRGYQYGMQLNFIWSDRPLEIAASLYGRLRDECFNVEEFFALIDVRGKLEQWRLDYNWFVRTVHSVIVRPKEFADSGKPRRSRRLRRMVCKSVAVELLEISN
jgi:hypothetical protein